MNEGDDYPRATFESLEPRVLFNAAITPDAPDLVGTLFDAYPELPIPADGVIQLDLEITNQGTGEAGAFSVHFYLSDDDTITSADNYVGDYNIPGIAPGDSHTNNIFLDIVASGYPQDPYVTDNHYFLGMIVDGDNDVIESNESNNANQGELDDMDNISSEYHLSWLGNMGALPTDMGTAGAVALGQIGDEWIGNKDIDLFRVSIPADGMWGFDIDAEENGSSLDSVIHVYNSSWTEIASNDNGVDPDTGYSGGDPYWEGYLNAGTYYIGVRGLGNSSFSLDDLTGRPGGSMGFYVLTVEAGGPPTVDVHIVPRITSTTSDTSDVLPGSDRNPFYQREDSVYSVEVWIRSAPSNPRAITLGSVSVIFDPLYAEAISVDHGSVFTIGPVENIDNTNGIVSIGGQSLSTDLGDDEYVLLGKIDFKGKAPVDEVNHLAGPYGMGLSATDGPIDFNLVEIGTAAGSFQVAAPVSIRANIYDVDDTGMVDFSDFGFFVSAFTQPVGGPEPPYAWWADFDGSGLVDFADFGLFVTAFAKSFDDPTIIFPDELVPAGISGPIVADAPEAKGAIGRSVNRTPLIAGTVQSHKQVPAAQDSGEYQLIGPADILKNLAAVSTLSSLASNRSAQITLTTERNYSAVDDGACGALCESIEASILHVADGVNVLEFDIVRLSP